MKITDLINESSITLDLKGINKSEVIVELCELHYKNNNINNLEGYMKDILKRESQSSTGLEEGIAIPHAKSKYVINPSLVLGISKDGIDYDSLDGEPSNLFFMIAAPENASDTHIETLSKLTTFLIDDDFREDILNAKTPKGIISLINKKEVEEDENINLEVEAAKGSILAVTGCPTGIAHTYMAADALKKKAVEIGINIKVETNGSTGIKNKLTDEEIDGAAGIIIAADKAIEMNRFDGKPVLIVPVKDGIKRPEELINEAPNSPIYRADQNKKSNSSNTPKRSGFYKHLMNGVSNMLPFVVGGGILIAVSFMFGIKAFDPTDPNFNKFAKFLMDIGGGGAFALMVPILAGFIGMSIADRPGFMPAMVGGMMANSNGGGFLGGLLAGFIGGYVVNFIKKATSNMPESMEGLKPILIFPVLGLFITGGIMTIILGPIASINSGMVTFLNGLGTSNLIVLGIVLGGMMAVDMGGPINKAAFTFGIAAIASGNYAPHAAVMAGGMVPPLGIAIATVLFKKKFTDEERNSGKTNFILGASFITEGAIPFAAADPLKIIPACIIGSALAGGMAMYFGTELPAPHGGLFVIPIITHPMMYLLSVVTGSLATAGIIGTLKKEI
ncbi:PTS fructose transporter subunit IIABC [Psychrilyobacter atlanticus]|uniref:PTS fructose transporter subunit IIABC n=1 Tax=Psychrilyobacter atlanticus TaxID=271091 RepID=UPI0003FD09B8|nr:PTS fructose transporter subunit IIABC [Psychrilyobacter atlanticus]